MISETEYWYELSGIQSGTMYQNVKCVGIPLTQKLFSRIYNKELITCKDVSTKMFIRALLIMAKNRKTITIGKK